MLKMTLEIFPSDKCHQTPNPYTSCILVIKPSRHATQIMCMQRLWPVHISVRAKGAGGGAAPPRKKFFRAKTAKIYVISKRFSGKMFRQTGFLPPKSGNFLGKSIFWGWLFWANRCRPPKFSRARTPMPVQMTASIDVLDYFPLGCLIIVFDVQLSAWSLRSCSTDCVKNALLISHS